METLCGKASAPSAGKREDVQLELRDKTQGKNTSEQFRLTFLLPLVTWQIPQNSGISVYVGQLQKSEICKWIIFGGHLNSLIIYVKNLYISKRKLLNL